MKFLSFLLLTFSCFTAQASESKYIFIGQQENGDQSKAMFILDLMGDDIDSYAKINDNGEVYLKVDKITAIPRENFVHFAQNGGCSTAATQRTDSSASSLSNEDNQPDIMCYNCKYWFDPIVYRWVCPRCGAAN